MTQALNAYPTHLQAWRDEVEAQKNPQRQWVAANRIRGILLVIQQSYPARERDAGIEATCGTAAPPPERSQQFDDSTAIRIRQTGDTAACRRMVIQRNSQYNGKVALINDLLRITEHILAQQGSARPLGGFNATSSPRGAIHEITLMTQRKLADWRHESATQARQLDLQQYQLLGTQVPLSETTDF